jgi:TPR repeat protein
VAVDRCRSSSSNDYVNYFALLARLTQFGNPEACMLIGIQTVFMENHSLRPCLNYLTRAADGGHSMAAYLVAIFLYRHNGDGSDDNTARQYIRQIEGEEESRAMAVANQRVGG